ncbi:hypothetical protein HYDPIDRAFT_107698 [Hydnomerulius pinastri MD-312]|nr:hypothetical protein HYDPIDRAFT_107698 [Hydnomerulius pinastri MD-312]
MMRVDNSDVLDIVGECITNEYPLYLLHLPDMRLMSRGAMRAFVGPLVEKDLGTKYTDPSTIRRSDVEGLVRAKMHYAILSHKWLAHGEPTFQDLTGPNHPQPLIPNLPSNPISTNAINTSTRITTPTQPGVSKLRSFCSKAHSLGFNWAWSDTCCIDKSSSAELEESIRSMYNWYWHSSLCMVHLADTITLDDLPNDMWFTRGWTLQELLAPVYVKFYNRDWEPLTGNDNDKQNPAFVERLSRITSIPVSELERYDPETNRIREKMVWASKRRTTRIEDMAYCLMGIFDVRIAIAYGEGKQAFYRLQAEIMQNCNDIGIFVWSGHPSRHNSAIAVGPECYSPIEMDPNDGLTKLLYAIGGEEKVQMLLSGLAPPRGDTSFAITNRGIRLRLPLLEVKSAARSNEQATSGWVKYTLQVGSTQQSITEVENTQQIITEVDNTSAIEVAREYNDFKLAVIDYELADADPNVSELRTDDFAGYFTMPLPRDQGTENTLQMLFPLIRSMLPKGQEQLPDLLADARKKRHYTGVLLTKEKYQPQSFYKRIPTKDLIKVQRPGDGWSIPVTVYLK